MKSNCADGDAIVVVLTEQVRDTHLAERQRDGVSYISWQDEAKLKGGGAPSRLDEVAPAEWIIPQALNVGASSFPSG